MRRTHLVDGGEIDRRLSLRPGTAERLAKKDELPHVRLPNGVIRFRWSDIVRCLRVHQLQEEASKRVALDAGMRQPDKSTDTGCS